MKIEMREQITGLRNNVAWPPVGGVIELPDLEAAKLCAAGRAVPVVEERVEKAVAPTPAVESRTPSVESPTKRTRTRTRREQ